MSKTYDVVVIAPHPDDAEMGMGGTMIKLVQAGYSVLSICLTQGEMGTYGNIEVRKKEFEDASAVIGCDCLMLDFPDTGIENDRESRIRIARLIREYCPKLIFAPYYSNERALPRGLVHVDHYTTGALVRDAVKFARLKKTVPDMEPHNIAKLYFFMVPEDRHPNLVVDVSDVIEQIEQAVLCYNTQMAISFREHGIKDVVDFMRKQAGMKIGVSFAEQFLTDQYLVMTPDQFFSV
ncbi:hypothetical protein EBR25_07460 [bacterium]|nr:hypothetical protein [bacterium]